MNLVNLRDKTLLIPNPSYQKPQKEDVSILAKTIYGTARNDCLKTMEAIACVALNLHHKFDCQRTIASICMDSEYFFCWNHQNYNYLVINNIMQDDKIFATCKRISLKKLHNVASDITKGATRFHDIFSYPLWARGKAPCFEACDKIFYNNID